MSLQPITLTFLRFLRANPFVRQQIRAAPGRTLLYAGSTDAVIGAAFGYEIGVWRGIVDRQRKHPEIKDKEILTDVLARVATPGTAFPNLLAYARDVEGQVPAKPDGYVLWRVLSGIFASNASGAVSFYVGSKVRAGDQILATTEIPILLRNPNVDQVTKDLLAYYQRCLQSGEDINLSFISK